MIGRLLAMGLNPFQSSGGRKADIAMVVGALLVIVLLVAWAIFG